jgi:hypothetical protein
MSEITYIDTGNGNIYFDAIICKWESNSLAHFDSITRATSDCIGLGYSALSSLGYKTTSVDKLMRDKYLASASCGK